MRGVVRWSVRGLLLVVVVGVGLWGYVQGRQWVFRLRAERLLADVQRLQVQKSGWVDLQKVMSRWGRWGSYNGTCTAEDCAYGVMLANSFPAVMYREDHGFERLRGERLLTALGFRRVSITAGFGLHREVIVEKSFVMDIDPPADYKAVGYLAVISDEGPRVDLPHGDDKVLHPYHSLSASKYFMVSATPKEDAAERAKLMRFHFDCITALRPCEDRRRLLPEAHVEFEAQAEKVKQLEETPCTLPYWVIARDEQAVLVGDVVSAKRQTTFADGTAVDPYWIVTLKIRGMLKEELYVPVGYTIYVDLSDERVKVGKGAVFPYSALIVAGRKTDEESKALMPPIITEDCKIVEATPANLDDAERGVREDYYPNHY